MVDKTQRWGILLLYPDGSGAKPKRGKSMDSETALSKKTWLELWTAADIAYLAANLAWETWRADRTEENKNRWTVLAAAWPLLHAIAEKHPDCPTGKVQKQLA